MSTPSETSQEESPAQKWTGKVLEGIKTGTGMQTRYQLLDDKNLSIETVAGIKDMKMGKIKNGKPVGKSIIRFDTGKNTGSKPHINIDPKGHRSSKNPHIEVPGAVVKGAEYINKTLKYAGVALTVASVTMDIWRIGSAIKDDVFVCNNANEIILELEDAIKKLKKTLLAETDEKKKQEINDAILELEKILRDVTRAKKAPIKTIKTSASVLGGWGVGAVSAWGAATGIGAVIGLLPISPLVAVGGPIVTIVGAIGFGIVGGIAGSEGGEKIAEVGLTILDE